MRTNDTFRDRKKEERERRRKKGVTATYGY
jgi:hypothetical protein